MYLILHIMLRRITYVKFKPDEIYDNNNHLDTDIAREMAENPAYQHPFLSIRLTIRLTRVTSLRSLNLTDLETSNRELFLGRSISDSRSNRSLFDAF